MGILYPSSENLTNTTMALTATIAAAAAPAAVNLAANFLTSPKETAYEREMRSLARVYKEQAANPYMQTAEAQSQMQALDETDKKNRKRSKAAGFRGNATNEAKTAADQSANEAMAEGTNRIAGRAGRYRSRKLSNYMKSLGAAEQARANSTANWQNQVQNIASGVGKVASSYLESTGGKKKKDKKDKENESDED